MSEITWDGRGLPPQGTVCEFNANWAHKAGGESWHVVTMAYVSEELYVVRRKEPVPEGLVKELCGPASQLESSRFRRYRTPEQIVAEEREAAIKEMLQVDERGSLSRTVFCGLLYEAGYRKQVAP